MTAADDKVEPISDKRLADVVAETMDTLTLGKRGLNWVDPDDVLAMAARIRQAEAQQHAQPMAILEAIRELAEEWIDSEATPALYDHGMEEMGVGRNIWHEDMMLVSTVRELFGRGLDQLLKEHAAESSVSP